MGEKKKIIAPIPDTDYGEQLEKWKKETNKAKEDKKATDKKESTK